MTVARTLALCLTLISAQAHTQFATTDPRIRLVTYSPDQVVVLSVMPGYAAVISLGSDERVESIVVGNSADWQVTASKRGDDVVVKPLTGATTTNMVVVTGSRHFVFQLQAASDATAPYVLRFIYPDPAPARLEGTPTISTFRFRGDKTLMPVAMSDDGTRTRVRWNSSMQLPAVFAVERNGTEAIVNGRMVGDTFVIERVAPRFVFRLGSARIMATRRAGDAGR